MMYTLGGPHYQEGIKKYGAEFKKDVGGTVWETLSDVRMYLDSALAWGSVDVLFLDVYAVVGDWDTDTAKLPDDAGSNFYTGFYRTLTTPRQIVELTREETR